MVIVCGLSNGAIANVFVLEWPWRSLSLLQTFLTAMLCETWHEFANMARQAVPVQ